MITAHNGKSPAQARNRIPADECKGRKIARNNAGLLMGKDLLAQFNSLLVQLIIYIYNK